MKRKNLFVIINFIVATLLLTSCGKDPEVSEEIKYPIVSADAPYTEYTAKAESMVFYAEKKGKLVFPYAQRISLKSGGKLSYINAEVGMKVKKGDVVARLENSSLQDSITLKRNQINNTTSTLDRQILEAELDILKGQAENLNFKSPIDGVIVDVTFNKVGANMNEGEHIFTVDSFDTAFVSINTLNADYLNFGRRAEVLLDDEKVDEAFYVETIKNKDIFRLDNTKILNKDFKELKENQFTIKVEEANKKDIITVPSKALLSYSGSNFVYVLMNGNKVEMPVDIGPTTDGKTEITGGVNPGDIVLVFE